MMMQLSGVNLGERHKQFNQNVKEAIKSNKTFDDIATVSDIDVLYKIDIACEYKNIDYLIDVLKSGDSLHIARVLKKTSCIYNDDFSHIINPDYLKQNVFTVMPSRMKIKMLTELAVHIKNEVRSAEFFKFCYETHLLNNAFKFLRQTSIAFKKEVLLAMKQNSSNMLKEMMDLDGNYSEKFISGSFELLQLIIDRDLVKVNSTFILNLSNMYSFSNSQYLDLLESHVKLSEFTGYFKLRKELGREMSKEILKKYKNRVLANSVLYINVLNKKSLIRYTSQEEAKKHIKALLPDTVEQFWERRFFDTYNYLIELIPHSERYQYAKNIYIEKYRVEPFESKIEFFDYEYYSLMTVEQKEAWALQNLNSGEELLGSNNNYKWCQFLSYDKALPIIKKYIMNTTDRTERSEMLLVLVKTIRSQQDVMQLCDYYYERFINELEYLRSNFILSIVDNNNVYDFENETWLSLNNLLLSVDIYNETNKSHNKLVAVTILYHIVRKIKLPDALKTIIKRSRMYDFQVEYKRLNEEQRATYYEFFLNFFTNEISQAFLTENIDQENVKNKISHYVDNILRHLKFHNKSKENVPQVVLDYVMKHWDSYKHLDMFKTKLDAKKTMLERILKEDASLIVKNNSEVKSYIESHQIARHKKLIKMLRPYFCDDVSKQYISFLLNIVEDENSSHKLINGAIYGIFRLSNINTLTELMNKYAPDSKIKHKEMVSKSQILKLNVQKAICMFACFSRPPVPRDCMLKYIKGDYLKFCLPLFGAYLATLSPTDLVNFVESLVDSPVSVQKHGLFLAFHCLNVENLSRVLIGTWKRTKNPSIREVLYNKLFVHLIALSNSIEQEVLFETLSHFTKDLNWVTDEGILKNISDCYRLPEKFIGRHLETLWDVVSKFPDSSRNVIHKCCVLSKMGRFVTHLRQDMIDSILNDHINVLLDVERTKLGHCENTIQRLHEKKWELAEAYISDFKNTDKSKTLAKDITLKCIKLWKNVCNDTYNVQQFFLNFVGNVKYVHYEINEDIIKILEKELDTVTKYRVIWDLKLSALCSKVVNKRMKQKQMIYEGDNPDTTSIVISATKEYSLHAAQYIQDYIDKKMYLPSFNTDLSEILKDNVNHIYNELICGFQDGLLTKCVLLVCSQISELNNRDVFKVILEMIFTDCDDICCDEYTELVQKIVAFDDLDLKYAVHKKFSSDFKRRKYVH